MAEDTSFAGFEGEVSDDETASLWVGWLRCGMSLAYLVLYYLNLLPHGLSLW